MTTHASSGPRPAPVATMDLVATIDPLATIDPVAAIDPVATLSAVDASEPTDAELLGAVRAGRLDAYGQLYARHAPAAMRLGRTLSRHQSDVDDLVSETFAKVLATLRGGNGPELAFRAYLLTTMRNVFYDRTRRDRRIEFHGDLTPYESAEPFVDTTVIQLERSYAARAFAKLPERWRMVLWHTEVEGESPAQVAPLLGLTPNGVSALAYRARERLRQMYLQEHISDTGDPQCHWTADRLASSVRKSLPPRDQAKVDQHLAGCSACHLLYVELAEVNSGLRGVLGPLVLGTAAAGYLKAAALAKVASVAAVGVGASAVAGVLDDAASGLINWLLMPVNAVRRMVAEYGPAKLVAGGLVATTAVVGVGGYLQAQAPYEQPAAVAPLITDANGVAAGVLAVGNGTQLGGAEPGHLRRFPVPGAASPAGSPRATDDFLITPVDGGAPLVAGQDGVLSVRVTAVRLATPNFTGTSGKVGEPATRVTLRVDLPAGIRLATPHGGDGWLCTTTVSGALCTHAGLPLEATSTVALQVSVDRRAAGLQDVEFVVSSGDRRGATTLRFAIAPVGTDLAFAATGHNRLALTGNTLLPRPPAGPPPFTPIDQPTLVPLPAFGPSPSQAGPIAESGANLAVPAGHRVIWAGLFWAVSATLAPDHVALRGPSQGWHTVTGQSRTLGAVSQGYADVTNEVATCGGGAWWFAAPAGSLPAGPHEFAGWALVVAYADDMVPLTDIAVYAGPAGLTGDSLNLGTVGPAQAGMVMWAGPLGGTDPPGPYRIARHGSN